MPSSRLTLGPEGGGGFMVGCPGVGVDGGGGTQVPGDLEAGRVVLGGGAGAWYVAITVRGVGRGRSTQLRSRTAPEPRDRRDGGAKLTEDEGGS